MTLRDSCRWWWFDISGIDLVRRFHHPFMLLLQTKMLSQLDRRVFAKRTNRSARTAQSLFYSRQTLHRSSRQRFCSVGEREPAPLECSELPFPVGHVRVSQRANAPVTRRVNDARAARGTLQLWHVVVVFRPRGLRMLGGCLVAQSPTVGAATC